MTLPRPSAVFLVRLATYVLPGGAVRDRYRQEVMAELHDLGVSAQLVHALGFLSRSWALRRAVTGAEPIGGAAVSQTVPLHCRWHLYHHYRLAFTDDGGRYLRCADCGLDHPYVGHNRWWIADANQ